MSSAGADLLVQPHGGATFTFAVARLPWVMFLHVGDVFSATEAGWWLFGRANGGGLALRSDCPGLEMTVRGPLRPALDGADARLFLELAQPPAALQGKPARAGWTELPPDAATALVTDPAASSLGSVVQAPALL